ncbi:hypothetical protein [Salmonella phage 7-11]|uniref:Uncharacterized protein n=1 Tax=Salmonella phage 7-11 TaxID=1054968 RepID=G0X522_9CAUD|nr:hypothetical protein SaPh711_gp089 [Salmonella phage 7-11]AEK82004.1 hypothetical protein [Salmonella phage 7-11]
MTKNEINKKQLIDSVIAGKGPYCSLTSPNMRSCDDIGYVNSYTALTEAIAAFAAKHKVTKVVVMTGSNIMNCGDGPTSVFDVSVSIK